MSISILTYKSWSVRGRYISRCIALAAILIGFIYVRQVGAGLVLVPVFVFHNVYAWRYRRRECPIVIKCGEREVTFTFLNGVTTTWQTADIDRVDIRSGDLARPLRRVATFCRQDGASLLVDAEVMGGEEKLRLALDQAGIRAEFR